MVDNISSSPKPQPFLEITIKSANSIFAPFFATLLRRRRRPFVTVTTFPPPPPTSGVSDRLVYRTRVDETGGPNPNWGDVFRIPLGPTFFTGTFSCVYLHVYFNRPILGPVQVGWCRIPALEILDGVAPLGSARHLSYRLRDKDGSWSSGILSVVVRVVGQIPVDGYTPRSGDRGEEQTPGMDTWQTAIGVPVMMWKLTCHQGRS